MVDMVEGLADAVTASLEEVYLGEEEEAEPEPEPDEPEPVG